jgi:hypothetical protein
MAIRIVLETNDPPCGEAGVEGEAPMRFEGWLGLIRVLSLLVEGAPAEQRRAAGSEMQA